LDGQREDPHNVSEEELAAHALQGHAQAWNEIVRRHTHRVLLALVARGVRLDVAEDLTQEVWLRLIQQQRAGRLRTLRFPGIAIVQARWLALEWNRTQQRREAIAGRTLSLQAELPDFDVVDPSMGPEQQALHHERLAAIHKELLRCPARAQQVFFAVYGAGGRSQIETARDLGLSVQRVRQILCEVRARMRRVNAELEGEDETWST
jgi:RNA polymerase sigma factor (sigma-70 family)